MSDCFYRALEEKYRGSRELIKARQRVYLPFITPLLKMYDNACAIDVGCGRGEWLELLKEVGFEGNGVDLDDGMLAACRERGLTVQTGDAVHAIEALESDTQAVVSGFHVAEHVSFRQLQKLVQEALRVLKPAGLLILETPNPENIAVSTVRFYTDPTHLKPIPPSLLSFAPEFYGFCRTKVLRLQEPPTLFEGQAVTLHDVLTNVSPDFAVIAQKTAQKESLELFDEPFNQEYGISLEALAKRHVQQVEDRSHEVESRFTSIQSRLDTAEAICLSAIAAALRDVEDAGRRAAAAEARAGELAERAADAEAAAAAAQTWLKAVHASTSWKVTAPLRLVTGFVRSRLGGSERHL